MPGPKGIQARAEWFDHLLEQIETLSTLSNQLLQLAEATGDVRDNADAAREACMDVARKARQNVDAADLSDFGQGLRSVPDVIA